MCMYEMVCVCSLCVAMCTVCMCVYVSVLVCVREWVPYLGIQPLHLEYDHSCGWQCPDVDIQ